MVQASHLLRQRVARPRWALPAGMLILTAFYELGPTQWLQDNLHDPIDLEIFLYGVLSPLLAFWVLTLIGRWLDKTEQAEKAARTSDRRLASIMSASADAILGLDPVVQQVIEQTRARKTDRTFHVPPRPGLPLVLADRDRVTEVLTNLIDNADKYAPPNTNIAIEVRADQTEVTVTVRDHGRGLPPADLTRVFDKFYRSDGGDAQTAYGYGLGLYVCRRLIKAQGGPMLAYSMLQFLIRQAHGQRADTLS